MDPKFKHDDDFAEALALRVSPDKTLQAIVFDAASRTAVYAQTEEWKGQYASSPDTVATQVDMYISLLERTLVNCADFLKQQLSGVAGDVADKVSKSLLDDIRLGYFRMAGFNAVTLPGRQDMLAGYVNECLDDGLIGEAEATARFVGKFGLSKEYEKAFSTLLGSF